MFFTVLYLSNPPEEKIEFCITRKYFTRFAPLYSKNIFVDKSRTTSHVNYEVYKRTDMKWNKQKNINYWWYSHDKYIFLCFKNFYFSLAETKLFKITNDIVRFKKATFCVGHPEIWMYISKLNSNLHLLNSKMVVQFSELVNLYSCRQNLFKLRNWKEIIL